MTTTPPPHRYGRNQSEPGGWSITWPPHEPPCPAIHTGLGTPPAVICAFALST
jgi:hypothetical protein